MKILFDLLYIKDSNPSGIKKYGFKIVEDFIHYAPQYDIMLLIWTSQKSYVSTMTGNRVALLCVDEDGDYRNNQGNRLLERIRGVIKGFDLIISTCANNPICCFSPVIKHVGVIHDMQEIKLEWRKINKIKALWHFYQVRKKIRKLSGIIAISNSTKNDIKKMIGRRSHVIYYALEPACSIWEMPKHFPYKEGTPFILDVNTFYRYKNADILINAFSKLTNKYPNLKLYFKGSKCEDFSRLPRLVKSLNLDNKVYFDECPLSDSELCWLYKNASLFVSPSKMEGFGATPIEAIIHECQTVVSNIQTFKEVIPDDCVDFFDPNNVEDLVSVLTQCLIKPISSEEKIRRSNMMLNLYSRKTQVANYIKYIQDLEI